MQDWMASQDNASVFAIYVVRGQRKDADTGATVYTIELVGADALNDVRARYTSPECLLYAVQAHKSYDAPLLASVNRETLHDAEMLTRAQKDTSRLGAIVNAHTPSGELPAVPPRRPPPAKDTKPAPTPAVDAQPAKPPADDTKPPMPARTDTKREGEPHPSKPGRKRRLVVRKIKTKNEKGYTVTRDVEEYESYSEDESEEAPPAGASSVPPAQAAPPAPAAPAKRPPPAKSKPKSAQQASLTSFFTKR
ncbi:hypothetical protein MBRA1_001966 [Malassezia brasiliensis]|uniref:DNA polymerase delta subunit 3 n=1 Tax=Malassezia brasiliensis TaxID=1821822 RepID=A0AAF0DWI8_9BASI|nr:hypothetical protein MBRA1_001966 [Malassezia brasiliensis]